MTPATDRQKRAIRLLNRKYAETVGPLLAKYGGSVESLSLKDASAIMSAIQEKHPRNQEQERGEDHREQDEQERRLEEEDKQQDDDDDEKEHKEKMKRMGYRPGSKQEYIANALKENDLDTTRTMKALAGRIGKIPQLTFTQNVDGNREALPLGTPNDDSQAATQYGRALKTIFAVRRSILAGGGGDGQKQKDEKREEQHERKEEKRDQNREAVEYLAWCRQLRKYCEDKAADGHALDEIGMRPVEYGASLLNSNVPLAAIKHAITMHYPPEARRVLGVRDYDVQGFHTEDRKDGIHAALPYCLTVVNSRDFDGYRVPLALVGPKGTGKTTLARQIADQLSLPFGMVSMTSGTSPSAFNGRPRVADDGTMALITALTQGAQLCADDEEAWKMMDEAIKLSRDAHKRGDTVMSQFVKIYGGGGVFLFDEMDAADENLLLGVNMALANGIFANPATGEKVEQHPDFIPVAGMNTLGLGSGRDYNARNRLDAATLDRWAAGRVQIKLDPRIEESMFWSIINRQS